MPNTAAQLKKELQLLVKNIPLNGKLQTYTDPSTIGTNFSILKNLRYTDTNLRGIKGMTKVNTSALTTYTKVRSGIQYFKGLTNESHVLVEAWNSALNAAKIYDNTAVIPAQGNFGSIVWNANATSPAGNFSTSPTGDLVYCNGVENVVFGGNESRRAGLVLGNQDLSNSCIGIIDSADNRATISISTTSFLYIGSLYPLSGFKVYTHTGATTATTLVVKYWAGTAYTNVSSLVDNTSVGGNTLAQTGTVTFTDTTGLATLTSVLGQVLYWYQISTNNATASTLSAYGITLTYGFTPLTDLWDGVIRTFSDCELFHAGVWTNDTVNLSAIDFNSGVATTFVNIGGGVIGDGSSYLYVSSGNERLMGINFVLGGGQINSAAATIHVQYFDGVNWQSVTGLVDNTTVGGATLAHNGNVTWTSPSFNSEKKQQILGGAVSYYYRIYTSASLSTTVYLDFVGGITAPDPLDPYLIPVQGFGRMFLINSPSKYPNQAIYSAYGTTNVFNGADSNTLTFGDTNKITAAQTMYSQFGSNLYSLMVVLKEHETWALAGTSPKDWQIYNISKRIGCIAPKTLAIMNTVFEVAPGQNRTLAIWQDAEGIYIFDGRNIQPIHLDIQDLFDEQNPNGINATLMSNSVGFVDEKFQEYHWLFAQGSSTVLNKELVFDLRRMKWYEVNRNGQNIQYGIHVNELGGDSYTYLFLDTGYMEQMENGTSFDGNSITYEFKTGDMTLLDSLGMECEVRHLRLLSVAKPSITSLINGSYFLDSNPTANKTFTMKPIDSRPNRSSFRLANNLIHLGSEGGVFHSFDFTLTPNTNHTEIFGFEPLALIALIRPTRESVY